MPKSKSKPSFNKSNPVDYIASNKIVETLIKDYMVDYKYRDDLTQEIYLILLKYSKKKLSDIINKGQIKFFVARIIHNQFFSKTSSFYRTYIRPEINNITIDTIIFKEDADNEED